MRPTTSEPIRRPLHCTLLAAATAASLLVAGCQQTPPAEEEAAPTAPAGERVEGPGLGIVIAELPPFFKVATNSDAELVLVPAAPDGNGELTLRAEKPRIGGVNLVAAVEQHREEIEAHEGGEYKGQQELGSHLGTAFTSRGQYPSADGAMTEETAIFLVNPDGARTLELVYRYPMADDTQQRVEEHLFGVLEQIEPLPAAAEAGEGGEG